MRNKFRRFFMEADGGAPAGGSSTPTGTTTPTQSATDENAEGLPKSKDELEAYTQKLLTEQQTKLQQQYEAEKKEAERLSKLSADEKQKELLAKQQKEIEDKETAFKQKEIIFEATKILASKNISTDFTNFLCGADLDTTKKNIDSFEKQLKLEVEKAVNERLKGTSPKPSTQTQANGSSINDVIAKNRLR